MKPRKRVRPLGRGEYVQNQDTEIGMARWMLVEAISRVLPRFLKQLRKEVYPTFARLAEDKPDYWEPGWTFETWQLQSDRDQQLTPCLLGWAKSFHAEETWILEGALQTLWLWLRDPELREQLNFGGFRAACGVDTLSSEEDRQFVFQHQGWDPQFERRASFHNSIKQQFKKELEAYERRLCSQMESQGAVRVRDRYQTDNFRWFAQYQLGGTSTTKILRQSREVKGDESTILKGVNAAAGLLHWTNIRKSRKSKGT